MHARVESLSCIRTARVINSRESDGSLSAPSLRPWPCVYFPAHAVVGLYIRKRRVPHSSLTARASGASAIFVFSNSCVAMPTRAGPERLVVGKLKLREEKGLSPSVFGNSASIAQQRTKRSLQGCVISAGIRLINTWKAATYKPKGKWKLHTKLFYSLQ